MIKINSADISSSLPTIRKELTVTPILYGDYNKWSEMNSTFKVYFEYGPVCYLPWFYAHKKGFLKNGVKNQIMNYVESSRKYDISSDKWGFTGSLRPHQIQAVECITKAYSEDMGGVLSLDCGMGKTVVAIKMISKLQLKTLIIVHKDFLANQWLERLSMFLPNVSVGRIQGQVVDIDGKDVVIAMLQSMSMKHYDVGIFEDFKHVVVDECHHIAAKVFSRAMMKIKNSFKLGLSATPDRADGLTRVLKWFLGDIVLSLRNKNEDVTNVKILQYKPVETDDILAVNGKICLPKMLNRLVEDLPRNNMICEEIFKIVNSDKKRKILVLSDRREHLQTLMRMCNQRYPLITTGLYIGGMKQKDLDDSCNADVLLSTYTMTSEGFDLASLNTIMFASPKANIHQCVGRIHRKKHDINPLVIDIVDKISIFYGQHRKRVKFYEENEYTMSKTTIKIEDNDNFKIDGCMVAN